MKSTRNDNGDVKQRVAKWFHTKWSQLRAWIHKFWHRYQLTRWLIIVVLTLFLVMSIYLTIIAKTAGVSKLESRLQQNTIIYDNHNEQAGSLYSQKGTYVKLNKISSNVPDAVLSTEYRVFYH